MPSSSRGKEDSSLPVSSSHRHRDEDGHHERRRHHHHHHHAHDKTRHQNSDRKRKRSPSPPFPVKLPFNAAPISKHDLSTMKPVFASYLDIQKQLFIEDLPEDEIKGRWKSFMSKWNRGQLAEGWYDPATKRKAIESYDAPDANISTQAKERQSPASNAEGSDSDEDEYGPRRPEGTSKRGPASHPRAPNFSELALRDEQVAEDAEEQREDLRYERKIDRRVQRERLEELVPRAEPGTKERQLEKKQEKASAVREFRDAKSGGGDVQEVAEKDLMGDEGGADGFKRMKKEMERKKTEREQRKLDMLQARAVEREERLQAHREKEDKTLAGLMKLAREQGYL